MNSIAQEARFRQRVVKYFYKHGAAKASIRFKVCRQSVYNWSARYDGTWKSLVERSHRPHHRPKEHTQAEKEMILRRYPYYKNDMIALWDSLRKSGYTRSYGIIKKLLKAFPFPIREIQTDNGTEFTTALLTKDKQHRDDGKRFYSKMRMYCLEDGRKQIAAYNKRSNNIPKVCLKFRSPNEVLEDYLSVMW